MESLFAELSSVILTAREKDTRQAKRVFKFFMVQFVQVRFIFLFLFGEMA